jgi:putative membrane protein
VIRSFLAGTELTRFARNRLSRAALVVVAAIPLLYGALYLWAFWNPTGHLDRLPVALVVADSGATAEDGSPVHAGADVADTLTSSDTVQWHRVSAQAAADGLEDGDYLAVVTIPADFSADVVSLATPSPTAATLDVRYDDANGYTARTLVSTVMREVRRGVSTALGERVVDQTLIGFTTIHDQVSQAADGAYRLSHGIGQADGGAQSLATGAARLGDGTARLAAGAGDAASGADRLLAGADALAVGADQAADGAADLSTGLATLRGATATLPVDTARLADGSRQVADGNRQIADLVGGAADQIDAATIGLPVLADQLRADRQQVSASLADYVAAHPDDQPAAALLAVLRDPAFDDRLDTLLASTTTIRTAADTARTQTAQLADGAEQVAQGNAQLAAAAPQLSSGIGTAADGAASLADGTARLRDGAQSLASGAAQLATGSHQVASGAGHVAQGAADLADGANRLRDGLGTLDDGGRDLATGLARGAAAIPSYTDAERAQAGPVLADPVQSSTGFAHQAQGNGEGFTPYFSGLALYVGAMIIWMVLRPVSQRSLAAPISAWHAVVTSYLPGLVVGGVQVGLLLGVLVCLLGLSPRHLVATAVLMLAVSAAFVAVQQAIGIALGSTGRVLVLVLLMLQLTSAGGTYPSELTPGFFQGLHQVLPMTQVVNGLREAITGDLSGRYWAAMTYLAGLIIASLAGGCLAAARNRVWTISRLHPAVTL